MDIKKIAAAVVGLGVLVVVGLVAVISMQPAVTHVERSVVVAATVDDVWPYVADLRGFNQWSPFHGRDPSQVEEYSETSNEVGSWFTWNGNDDVGSGKMTITAIEPGVRVEQDLEFVEPFASQADVFFAVAADPGGTKVTWGFDSHNDFMAKGMSLVMDMDAMLGPDFEQGLGNLKGLAEAAATARAEREAAAAATVDPTATAEPAPVAP